jgi:hypothetical protein
LCSTERLQKTQRLANGQCSAAALRPSSTPLSFGLVQLLKRKNARSCAPQGGQLDTLLGYSATTLSLILPLETVHDQAVRLQHRLSFAQARVARSHNRFGPIGDLQFGQNI